LLEASGAVLNAINDALSPLGVMMNAIPVTPQQIIRAIHK
jgi:CO/xanthine dehydrogenase Mo-binding subunit